MELIIKELKNIEEILLCKVNHKVIGQIPLEYLDTQNVSISEIDSLTFTINKKYTNVQNKTTMINPIYDEIVNERFICIDGDYYVIKDVEENHFEESKTVTIYGQEKKLEKNNFTMSNKGLTLFEKDADEEHDIYSFEKELYNQTGWKLGFVEDSVRYTDEGKPKVRIQEDTDTTYYNFIMENIQDEFCCIPVFDRKNKTLNLYDMDSFGDDLKIVLTKDNYIKSLIRTTSSNDLITRLKLQGNEEKCVVEDVTATGYNYIENYSYFVQTKEMSKELIDALFLFEKITPDRTREWKELTAKRIEVSTKLRDRDSNETMLNTTIEQLRAIINKYKEEETDTQMFDTSELEGRLVAYQEQLADINFEIMELEEELDELDKRINELNLLCRRETAKDLNDNLIFTQELLDELKEFTYYDTYTNDSFTDANELIKTGEVVLERQCKPTVEFSIDSVNFLDKLLMKGDRKQWEGHLGLGDVICLYDKEKNTEEFLYFVGWEKDYKNNTLQLTFSNKKTKSETARSIADLLKTAKNNKKTISSNRYVWNNQKYNRVDDEFKVASSTKLDYTPPQLINKIPVNEILIQESLLNLDIGAEFSLTIKIDPEDATNKNVIWMSTDESIATVEEGLVKGIKQGICYIRVITEDGGHTASCKINVGECVDDTPNDIKVTGLSVLNSSLDLNINEEGYIIPVITPSYATNKTVTYSSSDDKIATVDKNGMVVGINAGNCKITVISNDNPKLQATVLIEVSTTEDEKYANLDNALILGTDRVIGMKNLNLLEDMTVKAKEDVDAGYFTDDIIKKFPSKPSCVIVMLGSKNPSKTGIACMKKLLDKLKDKYPSKKIYVIRELHLGLSYDNSSGSYLTINKEIDNFNKDIRSYCNANNLISLDASKNLEIASLLNATYAPDGFNLDDNGNRILFNNIKDLILDDINIDDDNNDDNKDDDNNDDNTTPPSEKTTKYVVTASSLNIRKEPNTSSEILGTFSNGDTVNVYSITSGWAKISYDGNTAYVSSKYIKKYKSNDDDDKDDDTPTTNAKRNKIVARAEEIYKLCKNGKAWYSQYCRTTNWNKKVTITTSYETVGGKTYKQPGKGKWGFDCSSTVGCCYQAAGYDFMRGLSCSGGTLQAMAKKHGATVWRYVDDTGLKKAKPGDIIMWANSGYSVTKSNMFTVRTHHTAIYAGNGYVIEASGYSSGIKKTKRKLDKQAFFMRIKELVDEDKKVKDNPKDTPKKPDNSNPGYAADIRKKICKKAKEITELHQKYKKATYCSSYAIFDDAKRYKAPGTINGIKNPYCYVCSSLSSCAYKYAGLSSVVGWNHANCNQGTLVKSATAKSGYVMKKLTSKTIDELLPGDLLMISNGTVPKNLTVSWASAPNGAYRKDKGTHHVIVYMGKKDGKRMIAHASGNKAWPRAIRYEKMFDCYSSSYWYKHAFILRPWDLAKADKEAASKTPSKPKKPSKTPTKGKEEYKNCFKESGTKDGHKYVYKFKGARLTAYGGDGTTASGQRPVAGKTCAGHNMPYGTKIYIPAMKGRAGCKTGIFTVNDTGGFCFDFDLFLHQSSDSQAGKMLGSPFNTDVYVLEWGKGKTASSFTDMIVVCNKYYNLSSFHSAWTKYISNGGVTLNFLKYSNEDANIRSSKWWKRL